MKKLKLKITSIFVTVFLFIPAILLAQAEEDKHGYVSVNGLEMYYEIYSPDQQGTPLVLLHGAFGNVEGPIAELAQKLDDQRTVITFAMQGHGRTADINRPIKFTLMDDDVAEALNKLGYNRVDLFGYSMGGAIALQLTIAHPALVRKMIVASAGFSSSGNYAQMDEMMANITPQMFEGTPFKKAYDRLAPNPEDFDVLVKKIKKMSATNWNYAQQVSAIEEPSLLIIGDADVIRPEHAVKFFRLLGGGRLPNLRATPHIQLAILPGITHIGVMHRIEWIAPMIDRFLKQPMPEAE